ncbi:MAG: TonB-dependent receptor [Bacteroidales bacterium]|nr:TonB-dependent receptor [Bacteroidales bacterium]
MMKITIPRRFAMAIAALFIGLSAFAQTSTVSGVVRDSNNEPIIGAAVIVKGTTTGALTDADGAYSLKAKGDAVLVCQLFGYKSQEVSVNNRAKVDFVLEDDSEMLNETVVVGYGTLKKTQLVGSVENLSGDAIEDRPNPNIARSLQGQVAGLNIVQVDGKASHSGNIYIRGNKTTTYTRTNFNSSASGSSHSIGTGGSALVLIDGVEGSLSDVNPSDIETVAVLKDASSAAVYGSRGAFGVILVTTKNADNEKFSLTYNGAYSYNRRSIMWEDNIVTDGLQWTEAFYEFYAGDTQTPTASGKVPSTANTFTIGSDYLERLRARRAAGNYNVYDDYNGVYAYYGNTNWLAEFYKRGYSSTTQDISLRGSTKKLSYSLTGRYYGQEGIYKIGDDIFNTFNVRSKAKLQVTDWLSIDNNTALFRSHQKQPMFTTSSVLGKQIEQHGQPIFVPYNEDGTWTLSANKTAFTSFAEGNTGQTDNKVNIVTSTGVNIDIIKNVLKIRGDFSYKYTMQTKERYRAPLTFFLSPTASTEYVPTASSYKSRWTYEYNYITANVVGTWTPKLGDKHDLNVVGGWNLENYEYERNYIQRKGMLFPDKYMSFELFDSETMAAANLEQYDRSFGTVGFFARINYTFLKRYILEASARADGSSKFPANQRWGFFPSASLGWRLSEEPWMKWSRSWLDNFKIRANYGSLGNGDINAYYFLETMGIDKTGIPVNGGKANYTTVPSPIPATLTWETVTTYDIGLDADFLKSRLSFSGDIYRRYNSDLICVGPEIPDVYGASAPKGNYGELMTQGWELTLSWRDSFKLAGKDFNYSIKGSVWDSRTFMTKYTGVSGNILGYYTGKEIGEIWGFRTDGYFLNYTEANNWATDSYHKNGSNFREYAGDLKFIDINGDGTINYGRQSYAVNEETGEVTFDVGDLERLGNITPRYQFGLNLDFKWNGIGLSMFFQGVGHRDWYPAVESGYFWGSYNRPYSPYLMKNQVGDNYVHINYTNADGSINPYWEVTNADKKPYWTRRVAYSANRNVGPLTVENDYYMQNAAYIRLKNLTIDYTLPKAITQKVKLQNVKFYCTMENLFTWSPIMKHTNMFDPEVIGTGDTDFDSSSQYGLSGVGDGYSYPMLKSFTFGVNLTF